MTTGLIVIAMIEIIVFVILASLFFGVTAERRITSDFYKEMGWELERFKTRYERQIEASEANFNATQLNLDRSRKLLDEVEADKQEALRRLESAEILLDRVVSE
jgi:hypothetical protein